MLEIDNTNSYVLFPVFLQNVLMKMVRKGNKPWQSLSYEICSSYAPLLLLSSFCFHQSVPLTWLVGWYHFPREKYCTQPISPLAEIAHLQSKVHRTYVWQYTGVQEDSVPGCCIASSSALGGNGSMLQNRYSGFSIQKHVFFFFFPPEIFSFLSFWQYKEASAIRESSETYALVSFILKIKCIYRIISEFLAYHPNEV